MASQIISVSIVYSTVCSGTDQRKHQSSASVAFVRRIHRWPVNSPHKGPVTQKLLPFDDVIMYMFISVTASDLFNQNVACLITRWCQPRRHHQAWVPATSLWSYRHLLLPCNRRRHTLYVAPINHDIHRHHHQNWHLVMNRVHISRYSR